MLYLNSYLKDSFRTLKGPHVSPYLHKFLPILCLYPTLTTLSIQPADLEHSSSILPNLVSFALGLLCTAYHIQNNTQGFPLLLWYVLQHTRLSHTSVPLHMVLLPPKMPCPTSLRGNLFKTLLNSTSVKSP